MVREMMPANNSNMYFIYIDESYDQTHYAYSAVFINAFMWNQYFKNLLVWRKRWFDDYGIPSNYELHATEFVGGHGKYPVNRDKAYRADLFYEAFGLIENMEGVSVINAITPSKEEHLRLFASMLNSINKKLEVQKATGILICDKGNEKKLTSIVRKMKKKNHIPYNSSSSTSGTRNIPLDRIVEDPLFKTSESSYFIQLSDFLAFSLLRNEKPLPKTQKKVKDAFNRLDKVLVKQASKEDKRNKGIVRV